jgi:hypothetical protein
VTQDKLKRSETKVVVPQPPKDLKAAEAQRNNHRIYEFIMRAGGVPFGRPLGIGVATLTEKIVRIFKQRSFFGFETLEQSDPKGLRNKFTRHGAARYRGDLRRKDQTNK